MSKGYDNYPPGVREADIERHYGEPHDNDEKEALWFVRVDREACRQIELAELGFGGHCEMTPRNAGQELQDYLDDAIAGIDLGRSEELISLMGACLRVLDMMEDS